MSYEFGEDWFSRYIPTFQKYVAPLAGTSCALLEIGSYEGRCTTWLADNVLTHPASHLDTLDPHARETLLRNIERTKRASQITFHKGKSRTVLHALPLATYDFIYVDGAHGTVDVIEDAILAFQLAKVGAVIAFDDYLWDAPPWNVYGVPKPALDAFLSIYAHPSRYRPLVEVLESGRQIWIRKLADAIEPFHVPEPRSDQ